MLTFKMSDIGERTLEILEEMIPDGPGRVAGALMISDLKARADELLRSQRAIVRTMIDMNGCKREDVEELIRVCLEEVAEKTGAELDLQEQKVDELIAQGLDPVDALAKAIAESGKK